jgi:carbamoyltransferase
MPLWIKQKLWIKEQVKKEIGFEVTVIFPEHHESHAASAFYPSPYEQAAFLTIDGVGEWATASYGFGRGNELELLADIRFPHSLGLLYSAFTYYLGFKVNSGEYKVMGLAPYGEPKYVDLIIENLIDIKADGSFQLNMTFFDYCAGLRMTNRRFHRLFGGPPRKPESEITQRHMDLARSLQVVVEEVVLKMAAHVRKTTGMKYLCLAGGVALNCVANGRLLREGHFDDIWIQPAAGDAGGALGAALLVWYRYLGETRRADGHNDAMQGAYLGPAFTDGDIVSFLNRDRIPHTFLADDALPGAIANLIAEGNVVGWFQGRMEFGPRALGSRSILGDARDPKMQEIMNLKIKFRESFRPFAPSVLAEKAVDYFDLDRPSPYMLLVAEVGEHRRNGTLPETAGLKGFDKLKAARSDIPAVTHVDHTARIQTVHRGTNALYHRLLTELDRNHRCGVIINTSFNVRGEPIVCSPEDAFRCFAKTDMDYLVLGNYLLSKRGLDLPERAAVKAPASFELD